MKKYGYPLDYSKTPAIGTEFKKARWQAAEDPEPLPALKKDTGKRNVMITSDHGLAYLSTATLGIPIPAGQISGNTDSAPHSVGESPSSSYTPRPKPPFPLWFACLRPWRAWARCVQAPAFEWLPGQLHSNQSDRGAPSHRIGPVFTAQSLWMGEAFGTSLPTLCPDTQPLDILLIPETPLAWCPRASRPPSYLTPNAHSIT